VPSWDWGPVGIGIPVFIRVVHMFDFVQQWGILRSLIDILLVAGLFYRGLLVIRGTRAVPMLWGLCLLTGLYFLATKTGLITLGWILGRFLDGIVLVIIVLFQDQIRGALTKVGSQPIFSAEVSSAQTVAVEDIVVACSRFSRAKIGALIVITRTVGIGDFVEGAVRLDALITRKLLGSIFSKESPLHDGAVIITDARIAAAGCVLPLTSNPNLDPALGTRHRAAIGITERSDAVVVVVSEETGAISLVCEGKITRNFDPEPLQTALMGLLGAEDASAMRAASNKEVV
jgi:diadenylate cyclase